MAVKCFVMFLVLTVSCSFASRMNFHDRDHLQSHMEGELDLSRSSEDELRFIYFQSHDMDGNQKLDGCELVQSLQHLHYEGAMAYGQVLSDDELSLMIDPMLASADKNMDGFIDYLEFVAGSGKIDL